MCVNWFKFNQEIFSHSELAPGINNKFRTLFFAFEQHLIHRFVINQSSTVNLVPSILTFVCCISFLVLLFIFVCAAHSDFIEISMTIGDKLRWQ